MSAGALMLQVTAIERRFGNKMLNMRFVVGRTNALIMARVIPTVSISLIDEKDTVSADSYEIVTVPMQFRTIFHILCGSSFLVDDGSASEGKYTAGTIFEQDIPSFVRKSREIGFRIENDLVKYLVAADAMAEDEVLVAENDVPQAPTLKRIIEKTVSETSRQVFKDWVSYRKKRGIEFTEAKQRLLQKLENEKKAREAERLIKLYENDDMFGAF